jgi:hypothetical protein
MSLTVVAPAAPMSAVPALAVLARIADEVDLDGGVRVPALAAALHARYFRGDLSAPKVQQEDRTFGAESPRAGRRGGEYCRRLAGALPPGNPAGSRFAYRTAAGVPSFVLASNAPTTGAASCFLHLSPGTAPEVFARLVGALDGYGIGFRAELAGDAAACLRADSAVVTVARDDAPTVARAALRLQQRTPFALAPSVPAFARQIGPGVALADEPGPGPGSTFGRRRCRLVAAGLVAAAPGADAGARRGAVLARLTAAGIDPAAVHLNPGNPEFRL